jgi:hypothetical protein
VTATFALTADQRDEFARRGVMRLEGLLSSHRVQPARDVVLRRLEQLGLWRDGAWRLEDRSWPQYPASGLKTSKVIGNKHAELEALLDEPALRAAVDDLLEGRAFDRAMYRRPQLLFTLPNIDTWVLPPGWHTDAPRLASGARAGVQMFACLDHVAPRSGGTLVIAGSHLLLNEGRSIKASELHKLLGREPFFRAIWGKRPHVWEDDCALPSGAVGKVALEVLELTGSPGDVWLVDLGVLHSGAPNAGARPRMMVTYRFVRADVVGEIAEAYGWTSPRPT